MMWMMTNAVICLKRLSYVPTLGFDVEEFTNDSVVTTALAVPLVSAFRFGDLERLNRFPLGFVDSKPLCFLEKPRLPHVSTEVVPSVVTNRRIDEIVLNDMMTTALPVFPPCEKKTKEQKNAFPLYIVNMPGYYARAFCVLFLKHFQLSNNHLSSYQHSLSLISFQTIPEVEAGAGDNAAPESWLKRHTKGITCSCQ